jgi:hypothetical protein
MARGLLRAFEPFIRQTYSTGRRLHEQQMFGQLAWSPHDSLRLNPQTSRTFGAWVDVVRQNVELSMPEALSKTAAAGTWIRLRCTENVCTDACAEDTWRLDCVETDVQSVPSSRPQRTVVMPSRALRCTRPTHQHTACFRRLRAVCMYVRTTEFEFCAAWMAVYRDSMSEAMHCLGVCLQCLQCLHSLIELSVAWRTWNSDGASIQHRSKQSPTRQ